MRPGHARGPDRRVVAGRRRATGRCGAGGIRLGPRRIAATATTGEPVGTRLPPPTDGAEDARRTATRAALRSIGRTPDEIAAQVVAALHEPRFYVLTHPERKDGVQVRTKGILAETAPRFLPLA